MKIQDENSLILSLHTLKNRLMFESWTRPENGKASKLVGGNKVVYYDAANIKRITNMIEPSYEEVGTDSRGANYIAWTSTDYLSLYDTETN